MKSIHKYLSVALSVVLLVGCNGFLDREAEGIIPNDDVFKDDKMTLAALANLYGRVNWGPSVDDDMAHIYGDEACWSNGAPQQWNGFGDDHFRVYDYGLIRNINQFLQGLRTTATQMEVA